MPVVKTEPNPVKLDTTTPHPKAREAKNAKPSSHKPREAVWQRDSFMAKLEAQKQSTPPREIVPEEASDPVSEAPDGAFRFDSEPAIPPVIKSAPSEDLVEPIGGHVNFGSDTFVTGPPLAEYYIPLKVGKLHINLHGKTPLTLCPERGRDLTRSRGRAHCRQGRTRRYRHDRSDQSG